MTIQYNPQSTLVRPVIELLHQVKGIRIISRSNAFEPNAATKAAMKEARSGNLKTYSDVKQMLNEILA